MKEQKSSLLKSARNVLEMIVIVMFLVGAVILGKKVWAFDFEDAFCRWGALIVGEVSYLVSVSCAVQGFAQICEYFRDRKENKFALGASLVLFCMVIVFQSFFWGIVMSYRIEINVTVLVIALAIVAGWFVRKKF